MKGSRHKNLTSRTNHETLKYWGKRDAELNLPTNSSISVTLNQDDLKTTTTATASPAYDEDILWLNGSKEAIEKSKRTQTLFQELRQLRKELEDKNNVCFFDDRVSQALQVLKLTIATGTSKHIQTSHRILQQLSNSSRSCVICCWIRGSCKGNCNPL
jgi:hypothetical protein